MIQRRNRLIGTKVVFQDFFHPRPLADGLGSTAAPPITPAGLAISGGNPPAEMTIGLIKARGRAVSQSACNLVHARCWLLIERCLQPSANLLASAARRDLPSPWVTASQQIFLLLHIRTRRRMAIVQEAFHRKP